VAPKIWGVFAHESPQLGHRLLSGVPREILVPQSRHNDVAAAQFQAAGYDVLLNSVEAGVHLAVERESGRWLLCQGHPEYEAISLLKEYKREVIRWQRGERRDYPPLPGGYLADTEVDLLNEYRKTCLTAGPQCDVYPAFPENQIAPMIIDTWTDHAVTVVANWLDTLR